MQNIWGIELKKLHSKSMYVFLALFCLFTVLDNMFFNQLDSMKPDIIVGNFGVSLFLTQLYLIYVASVAITSDFNLGTARTLYTGVYSRMQIVKMKAVFLLLVSAILATINVTIGAIIELNIHATLDLSIVLLDQLKLIWIYGLYLFCVLSFSVFISSLFLNRLYTLIINYFAFIFIGELVAQATQRGSLGLKSLMESLPFYLATNGFNQLHYSLFATIIILIFSIVMYGAGIFIFQKRDLL